MFLGITVIGWALIVVIYVPLAGMALWMVSKGLLIKGRARSLVLAGTALALAALPVADSIWLDWKFGQLCKGAGLKVNRVVETDGFFDDGGYGHWDKESVRQLGLSYVEWRDGRGGLWRITRNDGEFTTVSIARPLARYHWQAARLTEPIGYMLERRSEKIIDVQTGEVTASSLKYYRYPAYVDRIWWRYFDHQPTICGANHEMLPKIALIGINNSKGEK